MSGLWVRANLLDWQTQFTAHGIRSIARQVRVPVACLSAFSIYIYIPSGNRQKACVYSSKLNSPMEHCRTLEVHHFYCLIAEWLMTHFWPVTSNIFLNNSPGVSPAHCPLPTGSLGAATSSFRGQRSLITEHPCQRMSVGMLSVLKVFPVEL